MSNETEFYNSGIAEAGQRHYTDASRQAAGDAFAPTMATLALVDVLREVGTQIVGQMREANRALQYLGDRVEGQQVELTRLVHATLEQIEVPLPDQVLEAVVPFEAEELEDWSTAERGARRDFLQAMASVRRSVQA